MTNERLHPELTLSTEEVRKRLKKETRRGLLIGGVAAVAGAGIYEWVTGAGKTEDDSLARPERRVLDANGALSAAYLNDKHRMAEFSADRVGGVKPNGDIGMEAVDPRLWKMDVTSSTSTSNWGVTLADIKALPRVDVTTRFCCIEGWSGVAHWTGVLFRDFTSHLLGTGTKKPSFIYMATANKEYYVGLDRKSAMHPQTLLAYEQDGKPLEGRRGAPLRLVIPVKYGIKNIKQIGHIQYMDDKPADYWAEDGYDWFAGL